jgi:hypothetical protein
MKQIYFIVAILTLFVWGCRKEDKPQLSGIVTIDNKLYGSVTYYALGFTFATGEKTSTLNVPPADITIDAFKVTINDQDSVVLYFYANNYLPSFFCYGKYADASAASLAFNNLTTFTLPQFVDMGDDVNANQIWLYRTSNNKFAKIRIISTVRASGTIKPDAECTFEWAYQPSGTLTFPGK